MIEAIIEQSELSKAVGKVISAVAKKSSMAILYNIRLSWKENSIQILGTDLTYTILTTVSGKVSGEGGIAINARLFHNLVKELQPGPVKIRIEDNCRAYVDSANANFVINGNSIYEFPVVPGIDSECKSKIEGNILKDLFIGSCYAVPSTDVVRQNMAGVCVQRLDGGVLRFVATDGHRLALVDRSIDIDGLEEGEIVPTRVIPDILKLLDEAGEQEVGIGFVGNFMAFEFKDTRMFFTLVAEQFPDYGDVCSVKGLATAKIPAKNFLQALKRVTLLLADALREIRVDVLDGEIKLSGQDRSLGESEESIEIEYSGTPVSAAFSGSYLLDIAHHIGGGNEHILCDITSDTDPFIFRPPNDEATLGLVMPMRLASEDLESSEEVREAS